MYVSKFRITFVVCNFTYDFIYLWSNILSSSKIAVLCYFIRTQSQQTGIWPHKKKVWHCNLSSSNEINSLSTSSLLASRWGRNFHENNIILPREWFECGRREQKFEYLHNENNRWTSHVVPVQNNLITEPENWLQIKSK